MTRRADHTRAGSVPRVRWLLLLAAVPFLAACPSREEGRSQVAFSGRTMGTTYTVKIVVDTDLGDADREALAAAIEATLDGVDVAMSTYRDDSELSALNRAPAAVAVPLSQMTFGVLRQALDIGHRSRGAFDVTVGPLVNAWGFGPVEAREPPDPAALAAARALVGPDQLVLDPAARTVIKRHAAVYVDLSGIAKGFAVDRLADLLAARGYHRHLVEVGGEMRAAGTNLDGAVWRVGIERPDAARGIAERVLPLRDLGLATSGDYRNYREIDGRRISHLIDPRTAQPIGHRLASVSVAAAACAEADAWATALSVLGPDEGIVVAEEEGLAALLLVRGAGGVFTARATSAWTALEAADRSPSRASAGG